MGVRDAFDRVLREYRNAIREPFTGHDLARFIRGAAPSEVASIVSPDLVVKGSAGLNTWAATPWIATMDPLVTTSTQRGFYVVYLFNVDEKTVHLSLNQGVTAVEQEFGRGARQKAVLEARAEVMRGRLRKVRGFSSEPIALSDATHLSKSYRWGHILGTTYSAANLPPDDSIADDLRRMVAAYRELIMKNGYVLEEEPEAGDPTHDTVIERRLTRLHERIERRAADPEKIKKIKGLTCEVCGFNFAQTYGELGAGFIEAHHLVPIGDLAADASRVVNLAKDFAVLCANCHRMAHRLDDPSRLEELRAAMRLADST